MRDMRSIYQEKDFIEAKAKFIKNFSSNCNDQDNCHWKIFKKSFLKFTKCKCPICENKIDEYDDIDHYRPKNAGYKFLECCCNNYMIMCSVCNRKHKHTNFPLDTEYKGTCAKTICKEKPLLVNPLTDNIFDYFELLFISSGESLRLELRPKKSLDENTYEFRKALQTIKTYGIGMCETNSKINHCRISIFEDHYEDFLIFAQAREKSLKEFLRLCKERPKKTEYGFMKFIAQEQFKIAI